MRAVIATLLLLLSATLQAADRIPVFYKQTTKDAIGKQLAYRLKEEIRRSSGFTLVNTEDDAKIKVIILTTPLADQENDFKNSWSANSVVIAFENPHDFLWLYYNNSLGHCGVDRLAECAADLVVFLDEAGEEIVKIRDKLRNEQGA